MKNGIIKFFSILLCVSVIVSCSKKEPDGKPSEETAMVDFGEGVYRPNPFKFLDNVPPFSWLGMPDSVVGQSEITISFNEDAVRSKSSGTIFLADASGNRIERIQIGDKGQSEIDFVASDKEVTIPVTFRVNPEVGDSLLTGSIMVIADKLDVVNDTEVMSYATPVAGWQLKHQIGINWWRWVYLILILLIGVGLIAFVVYLLWKAVAILAAQRYVTKPRRSTAKRRQQKRKEKAPRHKLHRYLRERQDILMSHEKTVSEKATALTEMCQYVYYVLTDPIRSEQFSLMVDNVSAMIVSLNKNFDLPTNNGQWSGRDGESMWIPDDSFTPGNRGGYSNKDHLPWYKIKRKYGYRGTPFQKGVPDFSNVSKYAVELPNFADYIHVDDSRERSKLHDAAYRRLGKKLGLPISEKKHLKDYNLLRDPNAYTWHELTDCRTLILVPYEVHGNINHIGGIAVLIQLRQFGFVS